MMRLLSFVGALAGLAGVLACGTGAEPPPLPPLSVETFAGPAAGTRTDATTTDATSVQMTSAHDRLVVSWIEGSGAATSVRFAERSGERWSMPRAVVTGERVLVNLADVPSVQALRDGRLLAQWLESNGSDPDAYDLRIAWSADAGATWSAAITPHDDGLRAQHGFASLFDRSDGGFGLVWLDGREVAGGLIGNMTLRAAAFNSAGTQVGQTVVDGRVCECCQTAAAGVGTGAIVAYRDRSDEEVRDIAVVRLEGDAWTEPSTVHDDEWKINGCPVNGPAVAALGDEVAVAWFTAVRDEGHAYVAFSSDRGRSFDAPIRLDDAAAAGRVQVVMTGAGEAAASWIEVVDGVQTFRLRRVRADGARSPSTTVAGRMGRQYARLARNGSDLLLAWVEVTDGASQLKMARARLM